MKLKLKNTPDSTSMLGMVGLKNPFALAIFFQLLESDNGEMMVGNLWHPKKAGKAVEDLSRMGLVEIDTQMFRVVRLIESVCVEGAKKRVSKGGSNQPQKPWNERYAERGGKPENLAWIKGDTIPGRFYLEEFANNMSMDEVFINYAKIVKFIWEGYSASPLTYILSRKTQLKFKSYQEYLSHLPIEKVKEQLASWENKQYKNQDVNLTLINWNSNKK